MKRTSVSEAGSWVINFAPDGSLSSVQWGDGFRRLMGYSDQNDFPNAFDSFLRGIYPEDRDTFMAETTASLFDNNVLSTAGNDFRFIKKDGSVRWFRSRGMLSRDSEGRPVQYRGVTIDITHEKEHDARYAALQNEAASPDTIHEMLGSGKWTMDFDETGRMVRILRHCRVLLAEDVPVNAEILMMVLSMREIQADHAENGRVAVEMFEQHEEGYYDAVLMDMRMPEMDGLEATRRIRAMNRSDAKSIPIIALTANAFDKDVQHSMQAGLNAHLSKPVDPVRFV